MLQLSYLNYPTSAPRCKSRTPVLFNEHILYFIVVYSTGYLIQLVEITSLSTVFEMTFSSEEMCFVRESVSQSSDKYLFLPLKNDVVEHDDGFRVTHLGVVNINKRSITKQIPIPDPGRRVSVENLDDRLLFVFQRYATLRVL